MRSPLNAKYGFELLYVSCMQVALYVSATYWSISNKISVAVLKWCIRVKNVNSYAQQIYSQTENFMHFFMSNFLETLNTTVKRQQNITLNSTASFANWCKDAGTVRFQKLNPFKDKLVLLHLKVGCRLLLNKTNFIFRILILLISHFHCQVQ